MSISNTSILIKRSTTNNRPSSLLAGEFAYSYSSNTLFMGSPTGNGVVNVGGVFYTQTLDAATTSNTASTLVKRDANGQFSGRLDGIAGKADVITNARNFSISGGDITASAQSFDGSAAVTLSASLNAVPGLSAGTYGSTTQIPVVTLAANGRVMAVSTSTISTTLSTTADSGTGSVNLLNDTLNFVGAEGITTSDSGNTVTFNVDDTVVRSNAFTGGTQTINTNLTIGANNNLTVTGNLFVFGNVTSFNIEQFEIQDPLLLLGTGNYYSDTFDIGFAAHYNDGQNAHTGLIRDAGTKEYHFFKGYTGELDANNNINLSDPSYRQANVNADYVKSTGLITSNIAPSATQDLKIGPLGKQTTIVSATGIIQPYASIVGGNYNGNQIDVASVGFGTQIKGLYEGVDIRVSSDGSGSNVSTFNTNGTLTVAGKVTAAGINLNDYTQAAFNKANSAVVNSGGTDLTIGSIIIGGGGNNITTLANTTYVLTGSLSAAKTITSLTVDAYGRVTAATGADISIDTSQLTSGTLGYARGGTGSTSYTTGGLLIAGATGFESLANTTYTQTGTLASNNTITSITVDAFGRFTAATVGAISGLTVPQGGTGLSTITSKGITYGNGTGALGVTAAAGDADQSWSNQIMTVTNLGTPVWSTSLDGGQF
jgi:hypothetical protein